MGRATKGCGCIIAMLAVLAGAAAIVGWKYVLPWMRTKPAPPAGELQIHVLDVGPTDGDSILIIAPGGKTALVDAGEASKSKNVIESLKRYKVEQIDYFIATHPHPDHIGGAAAVLKTFKVMNVIDNGLPAVGLPAPAASPKGGVSPRAKPTPAPAAGPLAKKKGPTAFYDEYRNAIELSSAQYQRAEPGKVYDLGSGARLTILAPTPPYFTKEKLKAGGNEPNANSVVARLDYGDFSMLLPGDAEEQTEQLLLSKDLDLKATVLKVAHHGSKYATGNDFLKRVKPEVAIISDGEWNRYGHPSQSVLDRLKAENVKVFRTDLQGEITITTTGKLKGEKLYEIKTAKEAKGDVWVGREGQKDDSSRSGFIAYGDFGPPPKPSSKAPK